eukprot:TRINITY_DN53029_c0_g1_i4.p1 TRINITY_DN53029_c0_g1~~TRINITY_DN53029_c0_g1_i4.p1  ORF type:complete len:131 (-),score=43.56 TRINITY_DN53029_c0_g1_i4:160-552(-)
MQFMILVSLAAAAYAAPQIVPYVHEEIEAEPYVHEEPEISPLALGIVRPNAAPQQFAAPAAPQQFAASVQQQQFVQQQFAPQQFAQPQFAPQQFAQPQFAPSAPAGYASGAWTGGCYNNLGEGVPCRQKF